MLCLPCSMKTKTRICPHQMLDCRRPNCFYTTGNPKVCQIAHSHWWRRITTPSRHSYRIYAFTHPRSPWFSLSVLCSGVVNGRKLRSNIDLNCEASLTLLQDAGRHENNTRASRNMNRLFPLILLLSLTGCALFLVHIQSHARHLFIELERTQSQSRQIEIEWSQLRLDQSTLGKHERIDMIARRDLGMTPLTAARTQYLTQGDK